MARFNYPAILLLVAAGTSPVMAVEPPARPNVLFIAVDDLNHWVGHLGRSAQAKTPHIDRLAGEGVTFTRAYCAAPVCNPSRAALLSGLRPSTSGVYDNGIDWKPRIRPDLTLTTQFRRAGYIVAGCGKIYHGGDHRPAEWDEYGPGGGRDPAPSGPTGVGGIKFAPLDCDDAELGDYRLATWTIEQLARPRDRPLFLAVGFHKPHMPWNVPRKYYEQFPLAQIELPTTIEGDLADVPPAGVRMAGPDGDHAAIVNAGKWREAVQGYLAAVAFVDAQIGRVLAALAESEQRDNTIVVLWGDHGWHLGEKEHWRKFALWEEATRAPLIWIAPGITRPGGVCQRPVDFMSIYPTLCKLCGIATPSHVEGGSIRSLLADPASAWDAPALSTHGFGNHAVRSARWRYIRYAGGEEELYDHDRDEYEWKNLAADPALADVKHKLSQRLPTRNEPEPEKSRRRGQ